jgi:hypothetical protein
MQIHRFRLRRLLLAATFALATSATGIRASASPPVQSEPVQPRGASAILLAQAHGTEPRELEPRYQPVPPQEKSWYNSSYIFGMTRGVAESTIHPAGKVPLFLLTVPLDTVLLPFAAIGGLFG